MPLQERIPLVIYVNMVRRSEGRKVLGGLSMVKSRNRRTLPLQPKETRMDKAAHGFALANIVLQLLGRANDLENAD